MCKKETNTNNTESEDSQPCDSEPKTAGSKRVLSSDKRNAKDALDYWTDEEMKRAIPRNMEKKKSDVEKDD